MKLSFQNWLLVLSFLLLAACSAQKRTKSGTQQFSSEQQSLIMSGDSLKPMRVFLISDKEDSLLLRQKSNTVVPNPKDEVLQHLVRRMYRTVRDSMSMGVGIAAPQVGILKSIIWVQRLDKENAPFEVYLNPEIKNYSEKKRPCREGCLSIPNRRDTTKIRAFEISIEYDKMDGSHHAEKVEDFTSVIFQHEIDHLNGILYIDHLKKEIEEVND
ncbi:MAG: peptide deformylase [Reichenbachiella sp.]